MPFAKKSASGGMVVRRSAPMVSKSKFEGLVNARKAAAGRARQAAAARTGTIVGAAACAGLGYLEKEGKALPTLGGIQPSLLYGLTLAFVVPEFLKGKVGQMSAEAGAGLCGVAAYKLGKGENLRVSGEGDWE